MKAIMIMFDSLNRHMIPPYRSSDLDWIHAPNFARLAERTVVFDNAWVGSMPCMPARRELHTGRYNFLHRSWGPLEPFDFSMPKDLATNGHYTHLITDHFHYFKSGGSTYHNQYSSWEYFRGQSGDPWVPRVDLVERPPNFHGRTGAALRTHDANLERLQSESDWPIAGCVSAGLDFLEHNHDADGWFLQVETFDPHEPFVAPQPYRELYGCGPPEEGRHYDWPVYQPVGESDTREVRDKVRREYAALVTFCDAQLGRILEFMDERSMWDDTMLIVNTDHGFLLEEHDWWGKCRMPFYNEVARIPLYVWDPRSARAGERASALVQTIDLAPTLLDFCDRPIPDTMQGRSLAPILADPTGAPPVHEWALFGQHGNHVNITDGRWVFMRGATNEENLPLFEFTLMPMKYNNAMFPPEELAAFERHPGFSFTRGYPVLRIPSRGHARLHPKTTIMQSFLFDLDTDPGQEQNLAGTGLEAERRMEELLLEALRASEAPPEEYERLGLSARDQGASRRSGR